MSANAESARLRRVVCEATKVGAEVNRCLAEAGRPPLRRALVFELPGGDYQWGFDPEEWGPVEPFMSIRI